MEVTESLHKERYFLIQSDSFGVKVWSELASYYTGTDAAQDEITMGIMSNDAGENVPDIRWKNDAYKERFIFSRGVYAGGRTRSSEFSAILPHWCLVAIFGILPALDLVTKVAKYLVVHHRIRAEHCCNCGYDVRGITDRCPECGIGIPGETKRGKGE